MFTFNFHFNFDLISHFGKWLSTKQLFYNNVDSNFVYLFTATRERLLMGMGLLGKSSSKMGPVFLAVLIIILAAAIVSVIVTKTRTKAKKARILKQQQSSSSSDTIR